jgi:hypothetical protein
MHNSILSVAVAALALWTATIASAGDEPVPICGDVNDSGAINTSDALLVLRKGVGQDVDLPCNLYESSIDICRTFLAATETALTSCGADLESSEAGLMSCSTDLEAAEAGLTGCSSDLALFQAALTAKLKLQSTVTAVFTSGGLPAGVAVADTTVFALSPNLDTAVLHSSNDCSDFETFLCKLVTWDLSPPVPYFVSFSSGHIESGQISRIQILDGGYEEGSHGEDFQEDQLRFFNESQEIFNVVNFDGHWHDGDLPTSLVDAMNNVASPQLFELTFFYRFPGGFTTYNYDYASPQKYTIVTKAP